jgi:hypothetical protein
MNTQLVDLTPGQWGLFWQWAEQTGSNVAALLDAGKFTADSWIDGAIVGHFPSGLYGLIEPNGRTHT